MNATISIFRREFMGYFRSPVAYVFIIVFLAASILVTWFPARFFSTDNASLSGLFNVFPWIFLFLVPSVGMRLWAEEKRSGTWELLFTLPVSATQAVFGKFLAAWAFLTAAILLTFSMPLTVAYLGDPDWGVMASGYLGSILLAGTYLSVCSLTSAMTQNQVISFVISVIICAILVFLGYSAFNNLLLAMHLPISLVDALANFSFLTHFEPMIRGLLTLRDVFFFVSLSAFCLFVNVLILER